MKKVPDKEYMERLLQDLKVKARDVDDFLKKKKIRKIIEQFDKGVKEEYNKTIYSS